LRIAPASFAFTVLLGLLAALPVLSIDMSAPTLVFLPRAFGTSAMVAGLTLSLFMGGFALGQFGGGLLSDRFGRRPVLLVGLACYSAAGAACALAPTAYALVFSRFVQGIGAGSCSVQAFAIVQDLFEGDAARSKRSYVTVIFGIVPMFAPALGSLLSGLAGWRSVHGILALAGGLLLIVAWQGLAESSPGKLKVAASPSAASGHIWHDSSFVGLAAANALSYGCIFAYVAGSPVVIMGQLGLSPAVFAGLFAGTAIAVTAGAWTSGRMARNGIGAAALLGPSLTAGAVVAVALGAASLAHVTSGVVLVPLLLIMAFARGITAPNLQHLAIERRRGQAGTASAVVGITQILSGALASAGVAVLLSRLGPAAVAVPMALLASAALLVWRWTIGGYEVRAA